MPRENEDLTAEEIETLISEGHGCRARLLAAGHKDLIGGWVNAEIERGTNCGDIMGALMTETTATVASHIVYFYKVESAVGLAKDLGKTFGKVLPDIVSGAIEKLKSGELKHPSDK